MGVKGKRGDFSSRAVEEAKNQGVEVSGETVAAAEQRRLLEADGAPTPNVQGDKFLARFTKTIFDKKDEERIVEMELAVELTDAHKSLLDSNILNAIRYLERTHSRGVWGIEIPNQTIDLFLAPDTDSELRLIAAQVTSVEVSTVKAKGDGKTRDTLLLTFRVVSEALKNVTQFAIAHFTDQVWLRMEAAQGVLKDAA